MVERRATLLELAERIEGATGPDRELDALAGKARGWQRTTRYLLGQFPMEVLIAPDGGRWGGWHNMPQFTSSLDAAMSLVPEGWYLDRLSEAKHPDKKGRPWWAVLKPHHRATLDQEAVFDCATAPLALTAACLRARAALQEEEGR